jgi:uncharacterized protein (DUF58 family)
VQPTRLSNGFVILILVIAFYSLIFDDRAAALATGILSAFLLIRAFSFTRSLATLANSLALERTAGSLFVRQGADVSITTKLSMDLPGTISVKATDLLPAGAVVTRGSSSGVVSGFGRKHSNISYTLQNLASGEVRFLGVSLYAKDSFFSSTLTFNRGPDKTPTLKVYPAGEFVFESSDAYGEEEVDLHTPIKSFGIRSFREFADGDDPKKIDWKLTAKYDTLYVRDYMGRESQSFLIVIDVPDRSLAFDEEAFTVMKEAAAAAIATDLPAGSENALMIISGPNLLHFTPIEPDLSTSTALINRIEPANRFFHLYRHTGRDILQHRLSETERNPDIPFTMHLAGIYRSVITSKKLHIFEKQLARALHSLKTSDVLVFSLMDGDESHLKMLTRQAEALKMHTSFHVPKTIYDDKIKGKIARSRFHAVEVVG